MRNYIFRSLLLALLCSQGIKTPAQSGPQCRDINIPVQPNDTATVAVTSFLANAASIAPFDVRIMNSYGGTLQLLSGLDETAVIALAACPYLDRGIDIMVQKGALSCTSTITFKQTNLPVIAGRDTTVYCTDPLVKGGHIDGIAPVATVPCRGEIPATFVSDWVVAYECELGNDTAKVIYREYAAFGKSGDRSTNFDTIVVFRLPEIDLINTFCADNDTSYCGIYRENFGPFMVVPNPADQSCDTVYLLNPDGTAKQFNSKCGLQINVDEQPFPSTCGEMSKFTVRIKQNCYGGMPTVCALPTTGNALLPISEGYWECTFWHMELDTAAPIVNCGDDLIVLPTNAHDCGARVALPAVTAVDSCHEVKLVKAMVEGYGSYMFKELNGQWVGSEPLTLPFSGDSVMVVYEAYDICHNVGYDTCFIMVQDQTIPLAATEKKINVSLAQKKIWLDAEAINENSWDNCDISDLLVRRKDWQEACVDLCDSLVVVDVLPAGDTIWKAVLSEDVEEEVEAYYQNSIDWLANDGGPCGDLVAESWSYGLMKYATVECKGAMTGTEFDLVVDSYLDTTLAVDDIKLLGGGWGKEALLSCEDVCQIVTLELLVLDEFCNWSTGWTQVWVEDKSPISMVRDVTQDIEVTCKIFKDHGLDVLVDAATAGDSSAIAKLDEVFGTYYKGWLGPQGGLVDAVGDPFDFDIDFVDSMCVCIDTMMPTTIYDPQMGWITEEAEERFCFYEADPKVFSHGGIAVNCVKNIHCEEEVWSSLDDCGQGVIHRKWKIWKECAELDSAGYAMESFDTIVKTQRIWVGNNCELDPGMFELPSDTLVELCAFEYDGSGNVVGPAHPDSTGRPEYTFDDDCRLVGIGHFDKMLEVIPDDTFCYKILRTWCFADWCTVDKNSTDDWQSEADTIFKYVQTIYVRCTCTCILECSELVDTSIACADIPADVTDLYTLFDVPDIIHEDTTMTCEDFYLSDTILVDTTDCGFGSITRKWYLMDEDDERTDSCDQTIFLSSDSITIDRRNRYAGDAEPSNCHAFITVDPVEIVDPCPRLGNITITNDSPYPGNDASGIYIVGVHYITYTIASDCLDTIYITDTITVIDDVMPTIEGFSDPCVTKMEWQTIFEDNPLNDNIDDSLLIAGKDNCMLDTVMLVDFDTTYVSMDTVIFQYMWQSRDTSGNLSDTLETTILVSDSCGINQANIAGIIHNSQRIRSHGLDRQEMDGDPHAGIRLNASNTEATTTHSEYILYQNRPNPFRAETTIAFKLPQEGDATISIYDLTGRRLKVIEGHYTRGYHEINVQRSDLQTTGILYYRLDTGNYTATRKMILMQ